MLRSASLADGGQVCAFSCQFTLKANPVRQPSEACLVRRAASWRDEPARSECWARASTNAKRTEAATEHHICLVVWSSFRPRTGAFGVDEALAALDELQSYFSVFGLVIDLLRNRGPALRTWDSNRVRSRNAGGSSLANLPYAEPRRMVAKSRLQFGNACPSRPQSCSRDGAAKPTLLPRLDIVFPQIAAWR
jgi:hypothetical protein